MKGIKYDRIEAKLQDEEDENSDVRSRTNADRFE